MSLVKTKNTVKPRSLQRPVNMKSLVWISGNADDISGELGKLLITVPKITITN